MPVLEGRFGFYETTDRLMISELQKNDGFIHKQFARRKICLLSRDHVCHLQVLHFEMRHRKP